MKRTQYKSESGRSMVEMLGVLAIIGVLSVGGIAGYKTAMTKMATNKAYQITNLFFQEIIPEENIFEQLRDENGEFPSYEAGGATAIDLFANAYGLDCPKNLRVSNYGTDGCPLGGNLYWQVQLIKCDYSETSECAKLQIIEHGGTRNFASDTWKNICRNIGQQILNNSDIMDRNPNISGYHRRTLKTEADLNIWLSNSENYGSTTNAVYCAFLWYY